MSIDELIDEAQERKIDKQDDCHQKEIIKQIQRIWSNQFKYSRGIYYGFLGR